MRQNLNIQLFSVLFLNIQMKEIGIKNRSYYFFDDMINIKTFDSNLLKIDKT